MKKNKKIKSILIFLVVLYLVYTFVRQQITINNMEKELMDRQNKYDQLVDKNLNLKDELELSKSDSYLEKLARERLGLIKRGEIPVINNGNNK